MVQGRFIEKIMPYKRILDKQLWKDIIQHMVIPDQPVKSNILPERWAMHEVEISTWIDRKTISNKYSI
ncbi:hypothetical protein Glove_60g148 [Diversispora epigaea]|uniref:Uncharacterized protein n=1 Tax=Diversispora epigaea TaxID=1348612 RepID=A0A397JKR6_9GLOM|nr:hypothetical protein Glove_60g148 [Diversispora epigaea]